MNFNAGHLSRCIHTLESSLAFYKNAEPGSLDQEVFRNAIVKGYELTQETTFKLVRKSLKEFGYSTSKLDATPIKEILRLSATHGLITLSEVERWFAYRDNRNNTAHDYGEGFAKETLRRLPEFIADVKNLEKAIRAQVEAEA
jgi:nucleotidyltransferase substrate binding protein (TIGR01987 family)